MLRICIQGDLDDKEADALMRIMEVANRNKEIPKSANKVAWGVLKHILSNMQDADNWILGIVSIRK